MHESGSELDDLTVHGETSVGWCEKTRPNETVDAEGVINPANRSFGVEDPRAPAERVFDHPEVVELRDYLARHNGIRGLDICEPHEIDRAVRIFHRDGFVVVNQLLEAGALERFRAGSTRVLREILERPGPDGRKYLTESFRLPHRYSYGTASASRQLLHDPAWASMVDLPATTPILAAIFGSMDYQVLGAGGDLCLPGAIEYQHLHADVNEASELPSARVAQAESMGIEINRTDDGAIDLATQRLIVERTPPIVTINFFMSDLTALNGPIRQIPGTHASAAKPPAPIDEPEWMRLSTLVGGLAGGGVIRDNRAWHGATPNVSKEVRSMPNVEYGAPWLGDSWSSKTMPHEVFEALSPHAQHLARHVVAEPGVWPTGAGVMHPLHAGRQRAKQ